MTEHEYKCVINNLENNKEKLTNSLDIDKNIRIILSDLSIDLFGLYHKNKEMKPSEILSIYIRKNKDRILKLKKAELQKILYVTHFALQLNMNKLVEEYKILHDEYKKLNLKYAVLYRHMEELRSVVYELNEKLKLKTEIKRNEDEEIH